jgi:SAM-dependent methyltransferase
MKKCRACGTELVTEIINLKKSPPSNAYLPLEERNSPEVFYPLIIMLCETCYLVQTVDFTPAEELFTKNYAYLSSTSTTWLSHSQKFVDHVVDIEKLDEKSFVVELASNDGYLLQFFENKKIPNLGIEPTESTAAIAKKNGINVIQDFFSFLLSEQISSTHGKADLIIANNVYAHVPDIIDFTNGIYNILASEGVVSIEFPHVLNLIKKNQFDTIYHEHFSYLSLTAVQYIFERCDLKIINVEEIDTHGGSLRVWGTKNDSLRKPLKSVAKMLQIECVSGIKDREFYTELKISADKIKIDLLSFLVEAKKKGEVTVGYGAAAKGNTLLNFSGIDNDLISLIFDNSFQKQGKVAPGNGIPIHPLSDCNQYEIDNVIILPWNIAEELKASFDSKYFKPVNYYVAVPELKLI